MIMENNDDKTPIGRLFGCIDYFDLEQFDSLIDNLMYRLPVENPLN